MGYQVFPAIQSRDGFVTIGSAQSLSSAVFPSVYAESPAADTYAKLFIDLASVTGSSLSFRPRIYTSCNGSTWAFHTALGLVTSTGNYAFTISNPSQYMRLQYRIQSDRKVPKASNPPGHIKIRGFFEVKTYR